MSSRIEPEYRFRFSFDEIRAAYPGPEEAWAAGDFMLVSEIAPPGSELRACALVMVGLLNQGMELLERISALSPRGHLVKALGFWLLNRNADALSALCAIAKGDPAAAMAAKLRDLISAEEIRVIITAAVVPIFTKGDESAYQPVQRLGQFKVSHYATQFSRNAWPNDQHDPFDKFIDELPADEKPHFAFALTPQWFLPRNFEKTKIPRVIWCHDTDVFFNRSVGNLATYDIRLVCTSQEHFELQKGLQRPCFSGFMLDPVLCKPFPPTRPAVEKDIDVLFTGAGLRTYHSDRSRFLFQLSALASKYKIQVVDGHLREQEYFELLSRARFLPLVNRYSGQSSPRWRDALAQSTCVLYPEGSGYGNIGAGCFPYRENFLAEDIARHIEAHHLAQPNSPYHPTAIHADVTRYFLQQQLSYQQNMDRLLKIVAFAVLAWRPVVAHAEEIRTRSVWYIPPIDDILFGQDTVVKNIKRYTEGLSPSSDWDDKDYNNAAAVNLQLAALYGDIHHPFRRPRAYDLIDRGLEQFPNSLILQFNAAHWRFFETDQPNQAADERFESIIANFDQLEFSPLDSDVGVAVTFYERDHIFPYYDYCQHILSDEVLKHSSGTLTRSPLRPAPAQALLASAHGYLGLSYQRRGNLAAAVDRYKQALSIYPDNLPLMRQCLEAMVSLSLHAKNSPELGIDLERLFFNCVAKYPTVLLSEFYDVIPALDRLGRHAAITEAFAMWHQLGRAISTGSRTWFDDGISQMTSMVAYEPSYPSELLERIAYLRANPTQIGSATQFEIIVLAASDFARSQYLAAAARAGTEFRRTKGISSLHFPMPTRTDEVSSEAQSAHTADNETRQAAEVPKWKRQFSVILESRSWRLTWPLRSLGYRMAALRRSAAELVGRIRHRT